MSTSQNLKSAALAGVLLATPTVVVADYAPIKTKSEFVKVISNKDLTRLGITLKVKPNGEIMGKAMGWGVTGEWTWSEGYFCREMEWGGDDLGYNCQAVSVNGNKIKFHSDRGQGQYAVLTIR